VASTLAVDFTLAVGAMTETVKRDRRDADRRPRSAPACRSNISNEALTQVPISTQRRYQDVWALAPGVFVRPDQADIIPSVNIARHIREQHQAGRHGRHRPVRRRRLLGQLQATTRFRTSRSRRSARRRKTAAAPAASCRS